MQDLLTGLQQLLSLQVFVYMTAGMILGIVFGALPGLNANVGIVLCLPFTFGMRPIPAMLLLLSIFCGATYGGSITAILIGTPGTNQAAATVLDGYEMAKKGQPFRALMIALVASTIGGVISALVLLCAAPYISMVTMKFAPPELFTVSLFGLSIIAAITGKSFWKGLVGGLFGILISFVGLDAFTGKTRFAFGNYELYSGLNMSGVLLGLFAFFVILEKSTDVFYGKKVDIGKVGKSEDDRLTGRDIKDCMPNMLKSSAIGTVIGAIPGVGAGVASIVSYNEARRTSKDPDSFGQGNIQGVAAPEAGNNAVTGSALIPTLTLGVPGAPAAATLMGAFMMHGLTPGPLLFSENAVTMYSIMIGIVIANLLMYVVGRLLSSAFINVTKVPMELLVPALAITCVAGAYAASSRMMDVYTMLIFGLVSFVFYVVKIPVIPVVLGFILGETAEYNMRRALVMSDGSWSIFVQRPICIFFIILTVVFIIALKVDGKAVWRKLTKKEQGQST